MNEEGEEDKNEDQEEEEEEEEERLLDVRLSMLRTSERWLSATDLDAGDEEEAGEEEEEIDEEEEEEEEEGEEDYDEHHSHGGGQDRGVDYEEEDAGLSLMFENERNVNRSRERDR